MPLIPLYIHPQKKPQDTILVEIRLRPKNENFTFNPMKVSITNSENKTFMPISYVGPRALDKGAFMFYQPQGPRLVGENFHLLKDQASCFVLEFNVHASPDWNITMTFAGITERDDPTILQPIQFGRGSAWYIFWLPIENNFCES